MLSLRPYQRASLDALYAHLREKTTSPCIVLPTGGGKGVLLAQLARDVIGWQGRILIIAHVKELLIQTANNLMSMAPEIPVGIYSAGLGAKDAHYPVVVAGIQSAVGNAQELGRFDLVAVDEAHRLPPEGEGMYRTLLHELRKINPAVRLVGMTATPYRTASGLICRPENLLNEICHETTIKELIRDNFLSPIKSKAGAVQPDLTEVHIRAGEFVIQELETAMNDDGAVVRAVCEIAEKTADRKSVLVFCVGIDHANTVTGMLRDLHQGEVATVFGHTPSDERAENIRAFRAGEIKYLVNVQVLTEGFDAPGIDCVAILRPTMSPGLLYQMAGRGFRVAPGKKDCLLLDFGGNFQRHGPLSEIKAPKDGNEKSKSFRECPQCQEIVNINRDACPDCGYVFEKKEMPRHVKHDGTAYEGDVLETSETSATEIYPVTSVAYHQHHKKDAPEGHPPTMWVRYHCGLAQFSEWICFEHQGFARAKAVRWWAARSDTPCPPSVALALTLIERDGIKEPASVEVEADGKYLKVKKTLDLKVKINETDSQMESEMEPEPEAEAKPEYIENDISFGVDGLGGRS